MAGRGYEHYPMPAPMPGPPAQGMPIPLPLVENMAAQGPPPRRKFHGPRMSDAKAAEMGFLFAPNPGPNEGWPTSPAGVFDRMDDEVEIMDRSLTNPEYWNIMLGEPSDAPVPWSS